MLVKKCEWISKDAEEAMLYVGSKPFQCLAFCHPCHLKAGDNLEYPLLAVDVTGVIKQEKSSKLKIQKKDNDFSYQIVGVMVDASSRLVCVDEIHIELDESIPGDISDEDIIEFQCSRLDVMD